MPKIKRHNADYDPSASFQKSEVIGDIDAATDAIKKFKATPPKDCRAFAALLILPTRK